MLNDLKQLFSRTWASFQSELHRQEPEDQVASLLGAMRQELVEARASLPVLEEAVAAARTELERERRALADCVRRRELAERIGDAETVRVADEYAGRHGRRVEVLEAKLEAAEGERDVRADEAERMKREYRNAEANRFALLARIRSERARGSIDAALGSRKDGFDGRSDLGSATGATPDDARFDQELSREATAAELEARLAALKRRMGQS